MNSQRYSVILLVGVSASIVLGFGSFFIADNQNITSAVIVGLLGLGITFMLELSRETVQSREQILKILDLSSRISHDDYLRRNTRSIVDSFAKISQGGHDDLFLGEAQRSLTACRDALSDLAIGTFLIEEERRIHLLIELLERARKSEVIYTTSYVGLSHWWEKELGKRYLKANYDAVERGVHIERIFLVRDEEEDDVSKFINQQREAGIIVRVVKESSVKSSLKENFFLIEGSILSFSNYSRDGELVRGYISRDSGKHQEYKEKFVLLQDHSKIDEGSSERNQDAGNGEQPDEGEGVYVADDNSSSLDEKKSLTY